MARSFKPPNAPRRDAILSPAIEKTLREELRKARVKYPTNRDAVKLLRRYTHELENELLAYDAAHGHGLAIYKERGHAIDIFIAGIRVIVMAARIVEEGDPAFQYRKRKDPAE